MYLFNGMFESPDDSWEKLAKALADLRAAPQLPGIVNVSIDKPDLTTMRSLVSNGATDWLIVGNAYGTPIDIIVNADMMKTKGLDLSRDLLKGRNLTVVDLARDAPDIPTRLLLSGVGGSSPATLRIPFDPVGVQPEGGTELPSGAATTTPTDPAPSKPPNGPEKQEAGEPDAVAKAAVEPPKTPAPQQTRAASAEVIAELAKARREVPADAAKGPDSDDLARRVAAAHLAEQAALNNAMVWQAAPDSVWLEAVPELERAALAMDVLRAERVWPASPDSQLLDLITNDQTRSELAQELLRVKAGIPATAALQAKQALIEDQRIAFEQQRVAYFAKLVSQADEYIQQRRKWRELADLVPKILRWSLSASAVLTAGIFGLLLAHAIDGWQAVMLVFVLAVAAISPAVLLLVERPLAGIDAFQPNVDGPAKVKGAAGGSEGDDASSKAGSGDDKKE